MPAPASPERKQPPLIVIVGPTAVGKTEAAIVLAERFGGEIVSADSRYLYRGMDIGTAKPSLAEQARVPHHLIDVTTPDRPWTLSEFQAAAYAAIEAIHQRGRVPFLVGGTGQYVRAVTEGWLVPPGDPGGVLRGDLEQRLAREGLPALVRQLQVVDPASAAQVDLRNPRRVVRALEVALLTGESFVAQQRKTPPPYRPFVIGLTRPRPELYARIDARVDQMVANGLVAEVQRLVRQGYTWDLPAMSALGYRQIGLYLRGEAALDEAVRLIKRDTRQFVRRQANWFKLTDPQIKWFEVQPGTLEAIAVYLERQGLRPAAPPP